MVKKHLFPNSQEILPFEQNKEAMLLPLLNDLVSCGFTSPAEGYLEEKIDLSRYLIKNPIATFFARARGNSLQGSDIRSGDLLVIDKSVMPKPSSICLCILDGEFVAKRVRKEGDIFYLVASHPDYPEIKVEPGRDFHIWGVVIHMIRSY